MNVGAFSSGMNLTHVDVDAAFVAVTGVVYSVLVLCIVFGCILIFYLQR